MRPIVKDLLDARGHHQFSMLRVEKHEGDYPAPQYLVDCDAEVVSQFRDWLDGQ